MQPARSSSHLHGPVGAGHGGLRPGAGVRSAALAAAAAILAAALALPRPAAANDAAGDPGPAFFETRIRPMLVERCLDCHGGASGRAEGGLRLDSRAALLEGGGRGPAVVPGQPDDSLLWQAVAHTHSELRMPKRGGPLGARAVADLRRWIAAGAPWPDSTGGGAKNPAAVSVGNSGAPGGAGPAAWWAFQPVRRPSVPGASARGVHPIDAFIGAGLRAKGLAANPRATRRELVRRASFDLLGLPPSPEEIAAFEADDAPDAWPRLVDRLLARPQYGERWGRHWLDVVRFAQSNGYERDGEKPEAWRYRDYVVRAFNADLPYDQFIREQLAGDELDVVTRDSLVATGFHRLGVWDDEPDDKRMAEFDELDDILSTTGAAFLGLTIGCARCHEHKFDPFPQADYYRLLSFFRNVRPGESAKRLLESSSYVPLATPGEVRTWREAQKARLAPLESQRAATTNAAEKAALQRELDRLRAEPPPFEWALAVRERGPVPPPTHVLSRGNAGSPGMEVQPAFPAALGGGVPKLPGPGPDAVSSGRRRALADWMASPTHPLTARVLVNRVWHHHFGRGIVPTTTDFGRSGQPPSHPELLDWLSAEFVAQGWSIKALHRLILTSEAYQRSSRVAGGRAMEVDPGNQLLWRQNPRRLDAEAVRDSLLAISGRLNPAMGGRGFFPRLSGEVLAGQSRPGLDWELSSAEERARRSLYAFVRRTMPVPMLEAFDYSNTTSPLGERPVTTVSLQALLLLNDEFLQEQAAALADRLERDVTARLGGAGPGRGEGSVPEARLEGWIERGFQLAVGRKPARSERRLARDFVARQERAFAGLRHRLTFRPDVPTSLAAGYMEALAPDQFLRGPGAGWSFYRGRWAGAYEGIRTVDRDRGPFALATGPAFSNGVVRLRLTLHTGCESAGLFLRAGARGQDATGYEVAVEPRHQRLVLRRHGTETSFLTESVAAIPVGEPVSVRVSIHSGRVQVWWGGAAGNAGGYPVLDALDSRPLPASTATPVGVRAWGAPVSLDDLEVTPEGEAGDGSSRWEVVDTSLPSPARRALEAFCLLLLNLNEVVHVD